MPLSGCGRHIAPPSGDRDMHLPVAQYIVRINKAQIIEAKRVVDYWSWWETA